MYFLLVLTYMFMLFVARWDNNERNNTKKKKHRRGVVRLHGCPPGRVDWLPLMPITERVRSVIRADYEAAVFVWGEQLWTFYIYTWQHRCLWLYFQLFSCRYLRLTNKCLLLWRGGRKTKGLILPEIYLCRNIIEKLGMVQYLLWIYRYTCSI